MVQLEAEQTEQLDVETSEQLKSLRIELQKSQKQEQEKARIQQETAQVFHGTVIQRQGELTESQRPRKWRKKFRKITSPNNWHKYTVVSTNF